MENIEIYRSRKKNIIILLVCIAFVCVCVYLTEKDKIARIVGWIGIAFFGACAVVLLYAFLRERLLHKPFLVITDSEVRMDGGFKLHSFRFSEVERFIWANVNDVLFITAVLNERAERRKMTDASPAGRFFYRADITSGWKPTGRRTRPTEISIRRTVFDIPVGIVLRIS